MWVFRHFRDRVLCRNKEFPLPWTLGFNFAVLVNDQKIYTLMIMDSPKMYIMIPVKRPSAVCARD